MEWIHGIFDNKFIDDDRIPYVFNYQQYEIQLFVPNYLYFVQIALLLTIQMFVGYILGIIIYYWIIIPKQQQQFKNQYHNNNHLLIGYGIVIPLALILPFQIMDYLDIRNGSYRMGLCSLPMTVTLGCLEAMHNNNNNTHSNKNNKNKSCNGKDRHHQQQNNNDHQQYQQQQGPFAYAASIGLIVRPKYNNKNKQLFPGTIQSFTKELVKHAKYIGLFTILYHITYPYDFFIFHTSQPANTIRFATNELGQMYNTFIQATMMNIVLGLSLSGVSALSTLLTGIQCDSNVIDNPMFMSTSPSDFWGRRWNKLIHYGLKHGIYKPIRRTTNNNATIAAIAAFCFSGLIHEYVWSVLFYQTSTQIMESTKDGGEECCSSCYCDSWVGKQLLFFTWNGILICFEYLFGNQISDFINTKLPFRIPSLIKSHLVVLLSLPVGHLFTADLTMAGFFNHMQQMMPLIKIVTTN